MNKIKNRIIRIRASRGYGIHSPFAFDLITRIIREKYSYYAYHKLNNIRKELLRREKEFSLISGNNRFNSRRVDELIFRLVNLRQPDDIVEIGTYCGLTTLYLASVNKKSNCRSFDIISPYNELAEYTIQQSLSSVSFIKGDIELNLKEQFVNKSTLEFVVINSGCFNKKMWEICAEKANEDSLYIVNGINHSESNKRLWKEIVNDPHTCLTFDIGQVGLVFFDQSRIKQHYILTL